MLPRLESQRFVSWPLLTRESSGILTRGSALILKPTDHVVAYLRLLFLPPLVAAERARAAPNT